VSTQDVNVPGWPAPKGYSNGRIGTGRVLHVGGQIGWDAAGVFADGFVAQFARTLENVIAVVKAAGGAVEDIADMTVFVTDMPAYRNARKELAAVWRERLGRHYPAMALVAVAELFEPKAQVEIQAVAFVEGAA
jgi:enamine deaminase RidA (YjgF/YER057c/UK114 family)